MRKPNIDHRIGMTCRLKPDTRQKLVERSLATGVTISNIVEQAISTALKDA